MKLSPSIAWKRRNACEGDNICIIFTFHGTYSLRERERRGLWLWNGNEDGRRWRENHRGGWHSCRGNEQLLKLSLN